MKRYLLTILFLATILAPSVHTHADPVAVSRITGSVEGDHATATLTVRTLNAETLEYDRQAEIPVDAGGRFSFEWPTPEPDVMKLESGDRRAWLYLDAPEEIRVILRTRADGRAVVEGSSGNRRLDRFGELLDSKSHEYFDHLKAQGERAVASADDAEIKALEAVRDKNLELFYQDLGRGLEAMGPSAAVFGGLEYLDVFKQRHLFDAASDRLAAWNPDAKATRAVRQVLLQSKKAAAGAPAPPFNLEDQDGRQVTLADLRGKWVFLDFWASWCLNCRIEMPRLAEVYEEHRGDAFEILGITARDTPDAWRRTIAEHELPWANLWDGDSEVADRYLVSSQLPASFLIDPQGQIVARNLSAEALREELGRRIGDATRD